MFNQECPVYFTDPFADPGFILTCVILLLLLIIGPSFGLL